MKVNSALKVGILILIVLLLAGCSEPEPSDIATEFVAHHPDLKPSSVNHVLKSRVPDHVLENLGNSGLPLQDIEHKIIEHVLEKSWDEFRGVGFLQHPDRRAQANIYRPRAYFYPYIGYDQNSYWVWVRAVYEADSWLFINQVMVLVGDKVYKTERVSIFDDNVVREVESGGIMERVDFSMRLSGTKDLAYAIANAQEGEEIKVRFVGDTYHYDFYLSTPVRRAWQDIIWYYDRVTR